MNSLWFWLLINAQMFEGRYTTMGSRSTLHPRTVRTQLNANLGKSSRRHLMKAVVLTQPSGCHAGRARRNQECFRSGISKL